ncbi:MAG: YhfC family intramembrane metalloprotease [Bacillales bacterium]|nr:YhfC family intramembrane metalloprotease [Bacillales bacterium]
MTVEKSKESNSSLNEQYKQAVSKSMYVLPFYILVPVFFAVLFYMYGTAVVWQAFGLGALGWIIALLLRGPVSAIAMKTSSKEKAQSIVVSFSGPLEEGVRFGLLLLTSTSFSWAISLGQGWAAVEVLFTIVNGIVFISLANRTDEKAMQAKEMLQSQGNFTATPLWGLIERIFASAYHIGATLVMAQIPWTVLLFIPFHSLFNLLSVKLLKKSIVLTEVFIAFVGIVVLLLGFVLM